MTDQNTAPSPAPAESVATPSPDDSLKAIASEFQVEEQARSFTATPQPQPQPQQFYAPDPVTDAEGYKAFVQSQYQAQQQTLSQIREVSEKFSRFEQTLQQQRVNADVDRAVQVVNAKAKADPDLVEAYLNLEYAKNPSFKKIFDNRDRNPLAYDKALGVIADKVSSKFQVRQDPQIAENVRAAQSSQRTMATTKAPGPNEGVPEDPREFDRWWRSQIRG